MRRFWNTLPIFCASLAMGVGSTSCGGGGESGTTPNLVLLGFGQPNVSGVALNQPLIFTFSGPVDASSVNLDTLRVVGDPNPAFEKTHVDEHLVALLPRAPNFGDLSDVGLAPNTVYAVSLPVFPAVDTIESVGGKPLLAADTYTFRTVDTVPYFIESRRPLEHVGARPLVAGDGGRSDDSGCLQNPKNSLFVHPCDAAGRCFEDRSKNPGNFPSLSADAIPQQANSVEGGLLLCLQNEGSPRVIADQCSPRHDERAVGVPAAGSQNVGRIELESAISLVFNEQLDPSSAVEVYDPILKFAGAVELWRVALIDGTPLIPPERVQTNKPTVVQSLESTQLLLVPSAPLLQGIYLINLKKDTIRDLAGNKLRIDDRPSVAGQVYDGLDDNYGATVPDGWRLYFQTLQISGAAAALQETFGTNLAEWGDNASLASEPGVLTHSPDASSPLTDIPGIVPVMPGPPPVLAPWTTPNFTLQLGPVPPGGALQCGQSTTANWNGAFRFLNLTGLEANVDADGGLGRLKATWKPYLGGGGDGVFDSNAGLFGPGGGDLISLSTTPGSGGSVNGDGVYEYESFFLRAGDVLAVTGSQPLVILCRGSFQVDGTIVLGGSPGGFGLDTDGSTDYTNGGAVPPWGAGGLAGPGGGVGGRGAGPIVSPSAGASPGTSANSLFGLVAGGAGLAGPGGSGNAVGGGGGAGFSAAGTTGTLLDTSSASNGGSAFGTPLFERALAQFAPDRGYFPGSGISGGAGGGGGGGRDNNSDNVVNNGDSGGGGGGGGGGGLWVMAGGLIRIGGVVNADGGAGGSTYNKANQRVNPGGDGGFGGGDDFVDGLKGGAVPSGLGGPGGGGSGGAILLASEAGINLQAGSVVSASGGAGGSSGTAGYTGGAGAAGRITLMGISAVITPTLAGTVSPAPTTGLLNPTVRNASVGQVQWVDLFTPTVDFAPFVNGSNQLPFWLDNFALLSNAGMVEGTDFHAYIEYQGADTLSPAPGGPVAPNSATGLTPWSADINACDGKRFFRWRWRFFVADSYPGTGLNALPMPAIDEVTIPFNK